MEEEEELEVEREIRMAKFLLMLSMDLEEIVWLIAVE